AKGDVMATLRIVEGPGEGEALELGREAILGRARESALQTKDPVSSREHARVYLGDDGYHIRDLGSSNGTQVNGERIADAALEPGDRIRIASVVLEFLDDAAEADETEPLPPDEQVAIEEEVPAAPEPPGHADIEEAGYHLLKLLDEDDLCQTYLATELAMERPVAVQLIAPEYSTPVESVLARIKRASQVEHPTGATILAAGRAGDRAFLVRRPAAGESMWARCGKVPPAEIAEIGHRVAGALAESHETSVVHGSLRPDRIVRTFSGHVRLLGLGLPAPRLGELSTEPDLQKRPSRIVYMAPEQVAGGGISESGDVYSLGAVLYHLLCGRAPFVGVNEAELAPRISTQTIPPVRELRSETPKPLADLIGRMLGRDPTDRPETMEEVAQAFDELAARMRGAAPPVAVRRTVSPQRAADRDFFDARTLIILLLGLMLIGAVFLLGKVTGGRFLREFTGHAKTAPEGPPGDDSSRRPPGGSPSDAPD
ncbi:MAG: FHA domain-containing serine/threonine-protein kinase, partial [Planctomycetota bacterium]